MLCTFKKLIYPKTIAAAQSGDFTIAVYDLNEKVLDTQNNQVYEAKVVGYYLPVVPNITDAPVDSPNTGSKSSSGR